jgi:DNA ligase-1
MLDILQALEETSSRKDKENILKALPPGGVQQFKYIAFLTYDPSVDFYVKEFDESEFNHNCVSLREVLRDLEQLIAKRVFTGKQAKQWIEDQYSMLSADDAEVFKRVVRRDLRCGLSAKTINKVFPGTVFEDTYQRCSTFSEKNLKNIKFPCISQTKMDGLYCDIFVTDTVQYWTRNGSMLPLNSTWDQTLVQIAKNYVIMGEVVAVDDAGKLMGRAASNGYINSNSVDLSRVRFFIWDMVPLAEHQVRKSKDGYIERFHNGIDVIDEKLAHPQWRRVESVICNDQSDIMNHFRVNRERGEEGTIIKDMSSRWKPGMSKDQVKVKVVFECEMRLVGYKEGTGKNAGRLGALVFQSDEGEVEVAVGTGYSEKDRVDLWKVVDQAVREGWIGTIRANDTTETKSDEKMSLFHPRFVEWRTDKSIPDSREKIVEQVKSFTNALKMIK